MLVGVLVGVLSQLIEERANGWWALLCPHTMGAGVSFGLKYALKMSALRVVAVPIHELLHGSTLIFVVFFSFLILGECPTQRALLCCCGLTVGLTMTSWTSMQYGAVTVSGLLYNLAGAALAGCCFPMLRSAILELREGSLAITSVKLCIGAIAVLPLAVTIEGFLSPDRPVWHSGILMDITGHNDRGLFVVVISVVVAAVEQFNITLMCGIMSAVSVGVVDAAKFPIQWGLSESLTRRQNKEDASFWVGTAMIIVSGLAYAYGQWQEYGGIQELELEPLTLPHSELESEGYGSFKLKAGEFEDDDDHL